MNIPTAHSTESLERFLSHIQTADVPKSVSREYLKASGFTSGNDPELRHIFRLLGFLDETDKPLPRWSEYKVQGQPVLVDAIHECYRKLLIEMPDAPFNRSDNDLLTWFTPPVTGATRSARERAVRTFRKLCQFAGLTPDNRAVIGSQHKSIRAMSNGNPAQIPASPLFTLPVLHSKSEYVDLLEAIKEVFYGEARRNDA